MHVAMAQPVGNISSAVPLRVGHETTLKKGDTDCYRAKLIARQ